MPTGSLMNPREPLVSVCIPVLNGGELVARAVQSALDQRYPRVEVVVVVDAASTDATTESLHARFGAQIRLATCSRTGQGRTANAAIRHSRGSLVKFLDHDDRLETDCVSRMVPPFLDHPTVGIAFCRRRVDLHADVDKAPAWRERFGEPHANFTSLKPANCGQALFKEMLEDGFRSNWIGEPSSVMVRRSCLDSVGGFSVRTRQWTDFDLWLRLLAHYDAAFIDSELSIYRRSNDSLTGRNIASGLAWLDRLWIVENLMTFPEICDRYAELASMRERERYGAWRSAVRGLLGLTENSAPPKPWIEYMGYRVCRSVFRPEISERTNLTA